MIKILNTLIILISISSCSLRNNSNKNFVETVDLESSKEVVKVDTTEEGSDTYGPSLAQGSDDLKVNENKRKPVLAIDLVPALYASLSYITLFRELEKNKIYPNIINTSGFSLVIAALYAKYKSASKLEWKMFALLRKLKGVKVHTSDWYSEIEEFLNLELGKSRLEQFKILITVPTSSIKKKLMTTGPAVKLIMKSLRISNSDAFINRPHYEYVSEIKNLGVDLSFLISSFPDSFNFKIPNGFAWGLYTRVSGVYRRVDDEVLRIRNEIAFVDTLPNLSDMLINTKTDVRFISDKISQEVIDWINKNN